MVPCTQQGTKFLGLFKNLAPIPCPISVSCFGREQGSVLLLPLPSSGEAAAPSSCPSRPIQQLLSESLGAGRKVLETTAEYRWASAPPG